MGFRRSHTKYASSSDDSVGSATPPSPASRSAVVQRDQLGDAGGALAAFDFDHDAIVDPQAVGRDVLDFRDAERPLIREPAGTGER